MTARTRGTATRARVGTALLATAVAAVVGLTACAPGSSGTAEEAPLDPDREVETDVAAMGEQTLVVWDQEVRGGQDEQMTRLNAAFEEEYPNITIERTSQSFEDLATTLRLALSGDDAPDVVQANNARATMGAFVEAQQIQPLDPYAEAYGWADRFPDGVLTYATYSDDARTFGEGSLYGLPQVGEVVGVYYSRSALAGLGLEVPQSWEEFGAALATAQAAGLTPLLLGNVEAWPAGHVFGVVQGATVDPAVITTLGLGNEGASWTTPENLAAAEQLASWSQQGYFNEGVNGTDYDAAWESFTQGGGAFLIAGSWLAPDIEAAMGEDAGFFAPPPAEAGGEPASTGGTGIPFTVTSAAEDPDLAAAYIDFITDDEAMAVLAETGNLPVVDTAQYAPGTGLLSDVYTAFDTVSTQGQLLPYLDYATPTMGDTLGQSLQGLLAGELTPEQFTQALEQDYGEYAASGG